MSKKTKCSAFTEPWRCDQLIRVSPPVLHIPVYSTGGLKQLYESIDNGSDDWMQDLSKYTDQNGVFRPEVGMPLLAARYRYLELLGEGQSAVLIKAEDTFNSNAKVSIKVLHTNYCILGTQEVDCLRKLNYADPDGFSPVIKLKNIFMLEEHYCMVFELLDPNPLTKHLKKVTGKHEKLTAIRQVTLQILQALGFLQQQNVIHADLKPDNILLKNENDFRHLKIIDLGNAIRCVHDELSLYYDDFQLQTFLYRAPEVMYGVPFGLEVDMWSLGCILAELYMGKPLFFGRTQKVVLSKIRDLLGPVPPLYQKGKFFSSLQSFAGPPTNKDEVIPRLMKELGTDDYAFADFIRRLLRYDPAERMTVAEAAQHQFLAPELAIKFLLPQPHGLGKQQGYSQTPITSDSYQRTPHIASDVDKLCLSSLELLRHGTQNASDISANDVEPNTRKVAQIVPMRHKSKHANRTQTLSMADRKCQHDPRPIHLAADTRACISGWVPTSDAIGRTTDRTLIATRPVLAAAAQRGSRKREKHYGIIHPYRGTSVSQTETNTGVKILAGNSTDNKKKASVTNQDHIKTASSSHRTRNSDSSNNEDGDLDSANQMARARDGTQQSGGFLHAIQTNAVPSALLTFNNKKPHFTGQAKQVLLKAVVDGRHKKPPEEISSKSCQDGKGMGLLIKARLLMKQQHKVAEVLDSIENIDEDKSIGESPASDLGMDDGHRISDATLKGTHRNDAVAVKQAKDRLPTWPGPPEQTENGPVHTGSPHGPKPDPDRSSSQSGLTKLTQTGLSTSPEVSKLFTNDALRVCHSSSNGCELREKNHERGAVDRKSRRLHSVFKETKSHSSSRKTYHESAASLRHGCVRSNGSFQYLRDLKCIKTDRVRKDVGILCSGRSASDGRELKPSPSRVTENCKMSAEGWSLQKETKNSFNFKLEASPSSPTVSMVRGESNDGLFDSSQHEVLKTPSNKHSDGHNPSEIPTQSQMKGELKGETESRTQSYEYEMSTESSEDNLRTNVYIQPTVLTSRPSSNSIKHESDEAKQKKRRSSSGCGHPSKRVRVRDKNEISLASRTMKREHKQHSVYEWQVASHHQSAWESCQKRCQTNAPYEMTSSTERHDLVKDFAHRSKQFTTSAVRLKALEQHRTSAVRPETLKRQGASAVRSETPDQWTTSPVRPEALEQQRPSAVREEAPEQRATPTVRPETPDHRTPAVRPETPDHRTPAVRPETVEQQRITATRSEAPEQWTTSGMSSPKRVKKLRRVLTMTPNDRKIQRSSRPSAGHKMSAVYPDDVLLL